MQQQPAGCFPAHYCFVLARALLTSLSAALCVNEHYSTVRRRRGALSPLAFQRPLRLEPSFGELI